MGHSSFALVLLAVFHVPGMDHRRLGIFGLPGDGLFFILLHVLPPLVH